MMFDNPTKDSPVRVHHIMQNLDISFLQPTLDELYTENWRFKFNPMSVLKTMIYWRLKGHRFLTDVFNDLLTDPTIANVLGFSDIPSYPQLYHFITYRLNSQGTKKIFDRLLKHIYYRCMLEDIELGREVIIDSTPFEMKNNGDATYNKHYDITGYKWHNVRCVQTDIPLEYHVSTITDYDGDFFVPLIYRLKMIHRIHPKRVFGDGHYSQAINVMRLKEYFDIETICHIDKSWILKKNADEREMKYIYQKFWKSPYFKPDADITYIKWFLIMHDETQALENYYHNKMLMKYQNDPESYEKKYVIRKLIEHGHGREKRHTEIKNIQANNMEKFTAHLGMHIISLLCLALVRLQNGITENLIHRGGLV